MSQDDDVAAASPTSSEKSNAHATAIHAYAGNDDDDDSGDVTHDAVECRRLRANNRILQGNIDVLKALTLQLAHELDVANARTQLYVNEARACTCRLRGVLPPRPRESAAATDAAMASVTTAANDNDATTPTTMTQELTSLYAALQAKDVIIDELVREVHHVSGAALRTRKRTLA